MDANFQDNLFNIDPECIELLLASLTQVNVLASMLATLLHYYCVCLSIAHTSIKETVGNLCFL